MRRIILLTLVCIFFITTLTSCYDANEIENSAYVLTIGIDKGVSDKWRITVQFSAMTQDTVGTSMGGGGKKTGGGGEEEQDGYKSVTIDCPSFFAGVNMLDTIIPRRLNFMHTKFIVFSEEVTRSGELGTIMTPLIRFRQIRRTMRVIVAKGSAMNLIKENKPYIGSLLSKSEELVLYEQVFTSYTPNITLNAFYNDMKGNRRRPIAALASINDFKNFKKEGPSEVKTDKSGGEYYAGELPREGGGKIDIFGTAVFDGDRMVGELDGNETRQMLIARGDLKRSFFGMEDPQRPGKVVPLDIREPRKPDVKVKLEGDKPIINLTIYLEGEILAIQSNLEYGKGELKKVLEKAVEKKAKENQDKLMEKCKALKADVFGFGFEAAMQFTTLQEWNKYEWLRKFANAEINVDVKFNIPRTGTLMKISPIMTSEGEKL